MWRPSEYINQCCQVCRRGKGEEKKKNFLNVIITPEKPILLNTCLCLGPARIHRYASEMHSPDQNFIFANLTQEDTVVSIRVFLSCYCSMLVLSTSSMCCKLLPIGISAFENLSTFTADYNSFKLSYTLHLIHMQLWTLPEVVGEVSFHTSTSY